MRRAQILGVGHYVPTKVVTNDDLAQIMPTTDEWIVKRTGIKERRFIEVFEDWKKGVQMAKDLNGGKKDKGGSKGGEVVPAKKSGISKPEPGKLPPPTGR